MSDSRPRFRIFALYLLRLLSLFGLLLGFGMPAPAKGKEPEFPSPKETWIRVESAHFTLFGNARHDKVVEVAQNLERFRAVLALFDQGLSVASPVPTLVYVFKNDASFHPYKIRFQGRPVELDGVFLGHYSADYLAINADAKLDPLDIIYHEYTHRVLHNNLATVPVWFGEGLAECYSTFQADSKEARVGLPLERHLKLLRGSSLMPLGDLLNVESDSRVYHEGKQRDILYAQSWALVHYLLWERGGGREQLANYLDRLQRGETSNQAFQRSFDTTHRGLREELKQYIEKPRFRYTTLKTGELEVDTRTRVTTMKRAEVLYRLGDLLAHVDEELIADAVPYFREALRLEENYARAHTGLGWVDLEQGRLDSAIRYFEKARALDPDDYLSNFLLADALLEKHGPAMGAAFVPGSKNPTFERARILYEQSIRARPDFAEAYIGYGRAVLYGQGNLPATIKLLETARRLIPTRSDVVVNLATLYQMNGDIAAARTLVEEVLPTLGDPEALKEAERTLLFFEDKKNGEAGARELPNGQAMPRSFLIANRAYELAGEGNLEGAIEYLQGALAKIEDRDEKRSLETHLKKLKEQHRKARAIEQYNRQVKSINEAVDLANRGRVNQAIDRLEKLLGQIQDDQLAKQVRELIDEMKQNRARRQGGGN